MFARQDAFSRLLDEVAAGEEIVIAKAGKPVAKLVPLTSQHDRPKRRLGVLAGSTPPTRSFAPIRSWSCTSGTVATAATVI